MNLFLGLRPLPYEDQNAAVMCKTVEVDTEEGRKVVVTFWRRRAGFWSVDISDELIHQTHEAILAALTLALVEMRDNDGDVR